MLTQRQREILAAYGFRDVAPLTSAEAPVAHWSSQTWERDMAPKAHPCTGPMAPPSKRPPTPVVVRPLFADVGTHALDNETEAA